MVLNHKLTLHLCTHLKEATLGTYSQNIALKESSFPAAAIV